MRPWVVSAGLPSWMSATSQLVPPMSKVMMFRMPARRLMPSEAMTPPAGPESTVATGFFAALPNVATPPLDCMM